MVKRPDQPDLRIPLHNLESVVAFGRPGASPSLMGALVKRSISLCFLTPNGRFLARIIGESRGNVLLRKKQYRVSDDEALSLEIAGSIISAKLYNSKWILERTVRNHRLRVDTERIKRESAFLSSSIQSADKCRSLEELRGVEGEGASRYFSVFDQMILQQKKSFRFQGRNRRPPLDNVNAMLSFGYTLLANDVASALEAVGLDAYVGFLHRDRPGRASLALDIMEELRGWVVDRLVLTLINQKMVQPKGFVKEESGGVIMTDDTKRAFLQTWQEQKKEAMTHPFLQEKIQWGLVPYAQAMPLSRFLRGDLDAYPVFFWK